MFLDGAGDDIFQSGEREEKKLFTKGQFLSGADSSGISLEVFMQYADACTFLLGVGCHHTQRSLQIVIVIVILDHFQSGNSTVAISSHVLIAQSDRPHSHKSS